MKNTRITFLAILAAAVVLIAVVPPLHAAKEHGPWKLRVFALSIDPDGDYSGVQDGDRFVADADYGVGAAVMAEYGLSDRLGVEFGILTGMEQDIDLRAFPDFGGNYLASDIMAFTGLVGGLCVHLTPQRRADLYVAPQLAFMQYDTLDFGVWGGVTIPWVGWVGPNFAGPRVEIDNDLAWGAALGLDVPFGRGDWMFSANLGYLDSHLAGRITQDGERVSMDMDPIMVGLGFGYNF